MKVVTIEIKRAIGSIRFALVTGIILVMFMRALIANDVFKAIGRMDVLSMLTYPSALSGFTPFAAIFPMLVYSTMFCEEYNSGYIKQIVLRIGGRRYLLSRILATAVSGAATLGVSMFLLSAFLLAIGVPSTKENAYMFKSLIWGPYVDIAGGALVLLAKTVLASLFGAVWALVALWISTIMPNRYVTLIAPFAIYQALWILLQSLPHINPLRLLRGDLLAAGFVGSFPYIVLIQLGAIILWGGLSYYGMKKRMEAY